MRRVGVIGVFVLLGCETYAFGPELSPLWIADDQHPECFLTEAEMMDGIPNPPCLRLWVSPYEVVAGEQAQLDLAYDFVDLDGDTQQAKLTVRSSEGETAQECPVPDETASLPCATFLWADAAAGSLANVEGGTLGTTFFVTPAVVGTIEIEVSVSDAEGFESNSLTTEVFVVASDG